MAYTTINKSSDFFNTKLYSGQSGDLTVTGVGFQPDWTWIKHRDGGGSHVLTDAVRGVTKELITNNTNTETTSAEGLQAFLSDGFRVGDDHGDYNRVGRTYASWNWKANGSGSSNTDGSRTTTVSANTTAGFSVGTCASLATNNDTLGHGLGVVPKMIMVKNTQATGNWFVYHASLGNTKRLYLNATDASTTSTIWNDTTPTSSVFTMKGGDFATGESLVFYAFAEKTGYSKFGNYTGNGNADGTFVYTGFKPAFVMIKETTDSGTDWRMMDNKRSTSNLVDDRLFPNLSNAENTGDGYDFLSNGFKIRSSGGDFNGSGNNYIYMAFAKAPLVGTNNVPCTAR